MRKIVFVSILFLIGFCTYAQKPKDADKSKDSGKAQDLQIKLKKSEKNILKPKQTGDSGSKSIVIDLDSSNSNTIEAVQSKGEEPPKEEPKKEEPKTKELNDWLETIAKFVGVLVALAGLIGLAYKGYTTIKARKKK